MAEPAFIAQFKSVAELWAWCEDNREKFTGIIDRIEFWQGFDWKKNRFAGRAPGVSAP